MITFISSKFRTGKGGQRAIVVMVLVVNLFGQDIADKSSNRPTILNETAILSMIYELLLNAIVELLTPVLFLYNPPPPAPPPTNQ